MTTYAVSIQRTTDHASIYFAKTYSERCDEVTMHHFETLAELATFVKSVRSGFRYTDSGEFVGPITRNHLSAQIYQINGHSDRLVTSLSDRFALTDLPAWVTR